MTSHLLLLVVVSCCLAARAAAYFNPDKNCADNTTFYNTEGEYDDYKLNVMNNKKEEIGDNQQVEEGEVLEVTCTNNIMSPVDADYFEKCIPLIEPLLETVYITFNGTRYEDTPVIQNSKTDAVFNITVDYLGMHKGFNIKIGCRLDITHSFVLISSNFITIHVKEHYNISISPTEQDVASGIPYTLTCSVENTRGLDRLKWHRVIHEKTEELECGDLAGDSCEIENITAAGGDGPSRSVLTAVTPATDIPDKQVEVEYICSVDPGASRIHSRQDEVRGRVTVVLPDKSWIMFSAIGGGVVFLVLMVTVLVCVVQRRRRGRALAASIRMTETRNRIMAAKQKTSTSNDYDGENPAVTLALDTIRDIMNRISMKHASWEKDKAILSIKEQIGVGNFGFVFSGTMPDDVGIIQKVAIKTIKEQGIESGPLLDFEKEMEAMTSLQHKNIVSLLGICTVSLPFYIIMEYMENGQLNSYVAQFAPTRDNPKSGLTVEQLAWMSQQPCDALGYLASRNMVHRDVSARNCLVGTDLQVKLADFGLSRDTSDNAKNYYKKEGGMVPVKWMSPEALTYGKYTTANDVWAYGVLVWETFSFGAIPYPHLSNQQVILSIHNGERLERPAMCPQELWNVILKCWSDDPNERIMFSALLAFLNTFSENCPEAQCDRQFPRF